ncbi:Integrase core domain protein [Planctomycetes bacterium Poly30]|uniref:Integrase core domain protein n=1 Tax=Saltatorellus ferox TaxID=2528018 RepID=A0A518EZ02_9BACT|nr:Integrase core domain protein [Planctomycetes bacterium Poly30]
MNNLSLRAQFRLAIVSQVLGRIQRGESRTSAITTVVSQVHHQLDGVPRRVSARSIHRWIKNYEEREVAGLERSQATPTLTTIPPAALVTFLERERVEDEYASIPELIRRARQTGVIGPKARVSRTTVYRLFRRRGISVARRKGASERDSRRFAYSNRMQMVLSDGKHFRAGPERARRLAMFFLDDCTRAGLHVVVGTSENAALFQRGLYECIRKFGLMKLLFLDNGPAFSALDTATVLKNLGVHLIHGEKRYPEGHGKIERFHRTAVGDVLRNLDGRPGVDTDCGALELCLQHYLSQEYGHRAHASLDGATPWERFHGDAVPLRFHRDAAELKSKFTVWLERRVAADNIVSIDSVAFEMPRGYAGQRVQIHRRVLENSFAFLHQGKLIDLHPVDLTKNAHAKRAKGKASSGAKSGGVQGTPPKSAADMAFERDFGSVVDHDGGFPASDEPESAEDWRDEQ